MKWTQQCEDAVNKVKQLITSDIVLRHYNPELPLALASDASSYGLGCVLAILCQMEQYVQSRLHRGL